MMRTIYIFCFMMVILPLAAQDYHPQRTAADIARKQTEMLVRELDITDSVLRDTLFRMHLKYALKRQDESYTRADILKCMQLIQEELKSILSTEQYEAFMNRQLNHEPRSPQTPCNWISPHPHHDGAAPPPHGAHNMPPPPPGHLPPDHL